MSAVGRRRLRSSLRLPLAAWSMLLLLGCGATIQAEDQATSALVSEGRKLYDGGQTAPAQAKAEAALSKSANNPQALYLRGLCCLTQKQFAQARDDLEKARKIDPLVMFAKNKQEFDQAWKTARDNTMEAQTKGFTTPPLEPAAKDAKPAAAPPKPAGPKPSESKDPLVRELAQSGPVLKDVSGLKVLGDEQRKALTGVANSLTSRKLTLKVLVLAKGADPDAEAKRLGAACQFDESTLLVVGAPGPKLAAYCATLAPDQVRAESAKALAAAGEAGLAKRMILVAMALGNRIQAPPTPPTAPPPPAPAAGASTGGATASPAPRPAPRPALPLGWVIGIALFGAATGIGLWISMARLLARRRLAAGFAAAEPLQRAVADRLTAVLRGLATKRDRGATAALAAAELAYFEAQGMMSAASDNETQDIARVERAGRLLTEAGARLDEADAALAQAAERPAGRLSYCWFTARPLADRYEADLVRLRHGDESRLVLAARAVGDRLRRGERPPVRVVARDDALQHWARSGAFEPAHDYYHGERFGWHWVDPGQLAEAFFDDPDGRVFVDLSERPDYTLDLAGDA